MSTRPEKGMPTVRSLERIARVDKLVRVHDLTPADACRIVGMKTSSYYRIKRVLKAKSQAAYTGA